MGRDWEGENSVVSPENREILGSSLCRNQGVSQTEEVRAEQGGSVAVG